MQQSSYVLGIAHALASIAFLTAVLILTSCGGSKESDADSTSAVDPRFATADALIDHINSLNGRDPVPIRDLMSLVYAENAWQREFVNVTDKTLSFAELQQECWQRWNEPFSPDPKKGSRNPIPPDGPAHIVTRDGQRAIADYKDFDKNDKQLHLVQIGPRWWVSGYTFEYDEEAAEFKEMFEGAEAFLDASDKAATSILKRVRNGEFSSAATVRRAFTEVLEPVTN